MNMKKAILGLFVIMMFLAAALPILAETVTYDKYLTAADVQKVSGLKSIVQKVDGKKLTFLADKKHVLQVLFQGAKAYKLNKETAGYVKAAVNGVGEEAFSGPATNPQYVLIFRKKDFCVRLSTFIDINDTSKTVLTMDQLIALGKIIASRI